MQSIDTEGKRLKYVREKILNVGQKAFGKVIGKDQSTIQRWESDKSGIEPAIKLLLEHVYGINPVWLETGDGEIIFEKRNLNGFQMPVYELSGKSYANLFKKDNIVSSKVILQADFTHNLVNLSLIVANKAMPEIEKGDLLAVSNDLSKSKTTGHYLVEDKGILEVRLLHFLANNIEEIGHSKTPNTFPFEAEIVSIEESQIKGKVIKIVKLWENTDIILI